MFEKGRFSDFQGLVTLTVTLDRVTLHTVLHHSSTSTYIPHFIEIKENVWTYGSTDGHLRPASLGRLVNYVAYASVTHDDRRQRPLLV